MKRLLAAVLLATAGLCCLLTVALAQCPNGRCPLRPPPPAATPASAGEGSPSAPPRPGSGIVEAGRVGPGGRQVMVDFPREFWKENIASRGEGCCVHRSCDFASHWGNVPQLWGFPEWVKSKGLPGGCYPELLSQRITAICQDRTLPEPDYVQSESKDWAQLELCLKTGRLACCDYAGNDGIHYPSKIAHMICICYCDADYVTVLDNNFPPDKLLWLPRAEYDKRWSGWFFALTAPRPPAPPWN